MIYKAIYYIWGAVTLTLGAPFALLGAVLAYPVNVIGRSFLIGWETTTEVIGLYSKSINRRKRGKNEKED